MDTLEMSAMIAMLVLMLAVIGAKIITTRYIAYTKLRLGRQLRVQQEGSRTLKALKDQNALMANSKTALLARKTKLNERLAFVQTEVERIKKEEQARRQQSGTSQ